MFVVIIVTLNVMFLNTGVSGVRVSETDGINCVL